MLGKFIVAVGLVVIGGDALAQSAPPEPSVVVRAPRHVQQIPPRGPQTAGIARGGDAPLDHGPNTPDANAAYQGGGMILEGPPGAPAPTPEPTPPGVTPRYMVEPGQGY